MSPKDKLKKVQTSTNYNIKDKSYKDVKKDIISQKPFKGSQTRNNVKPNGIAYDVIKSIAQNEYLSACLLCRAMRSNFSSSPVSLVRRALLFLGGRYAAARHQLITR